MANSSTLPDVHFSFRSISMPSRIHPTSVKFEAALNHLKTWQTSSCSTSNLGVETIQIGLIGLEELYNCVGELTQSPQTQEALLHYEKGRLIEEHLDYSVTLLDVCNASRDILLSMKEHLQSLQSALRRRGRDSRIENGVNTYITSRKKVKKEITKCLGELKTLQNKLSYPTFLDMEPNLKMVVKVLHETSTITISIFRHFFLLLSMPPVKTRSGGWSKIAKLIPTRMLSLEKGHNVVETQVGSVDIAIFSLQGNNGNADLLQATQKMLEELKCSIDGLETGLDSMFRCLVKSRVTFLDIMTQ